MTDAMPKAEGDHSYERDQVKKIIGSVISQVEAAGELSRDTIFKELTELHNIIEEARKEVGQAQAGDISDKHIPTATDELDAVVASTAEATGAIMDCCDVISEKAGEVGGEAGDAVTAEVMKIYEACSFQDITGQRITKVVTTLKTIEEKVDKLLAVLGEKMPGTNSEGNSDSDDDGRTGDEALLNGPALPDKAISQDDIDKLLAEFD